MVSPEKLLKMRNSIFFNISICKFAPACMYLLSNTIFSSLESLLQQQTMLVSGIIIGHDTPRFVEH